jgi:hypothetical protein
LAHVAGGAVRVIATAAGATNGVFAVGPRIRGHSPNIVAYNAVGGTRDVLRHMVPKVVAIARLHTASSRAFAS